MKNEDKKYPRSDTNSKPKSKQRSEEYRKYQKYIRSKEFQKVKDIVKERDKVCQVCGRTEEDIAESNGKISFNCHHRKYDNLFEGGEKEASDCILLCNICHKAIHRTKSNYQRFKRK